MLRHEKSAPIWLFSFVDLAFLLLIAFTQISPIEASPDPGLAQLEIPQIESPGEPLAGTTPVQRWQLRVHAPTDGGPTPFELLAPSQAAAPENAPSARALTQRIDASELAIHLDSLFAKAESKPVLTPHPDARAEDLLVAVGMLADVWQRDRTVAVIPRPRVAAGPLASDSAR